MSKKVQLTLDERQFVFEAGTARHEANKWRSDIADYDSRRFNLQPLTASRLGVYGEAAAFKALGGNVLKHSLEEWAHYVPNEHPNYHQLVKGLPDLYDNVEVRRANRIGNPIPIREKDRKSGLILVQVHVPYMQPKGPGTSITVYEHATVTGWAYASDWDAGSVPSWSHDGKTRVVEPKPMDDFPLEVIR